MLRRDLLKAGIGSAAALAAPHIGRAAAAKTLVVAPTADLVVLDPVVTFNRQTRNYAYLVFDTLFALDKDFKPLFTDSRTHNGAFSYTGISTESPQSQSNTGDAFAKPCLNAIDAASLNAISDESTSW